ncbi:MAG: endopolygalacturonase [Chitinivibrionales bacterium]|nr:endopolygalacturonase [Chitinivibrionales bacterium]
MIMIPAKRYYPGSPQGSSPSGIFAVILCLAWAMAVHAVAQGQNIVFPSDGGVVDVTQPPFTAVPDDSGDDTEALQAALDSFPSGNKIIYLPDGTYLVSSTLHWPMGTGPGDQEKRTILQGQSTEGTIIRLKDNCPGFSSKGNPTPVLFTGSRPAQRFRNAVRNCTIHTGTNNRGAIGIRFNASNQGCVRDVAILSGDFKGAIGLDMAYTAEIGPCFIKNVSITGFGIGIKTGYLQNGITFEHIYLENQKECGIYNERHSLSIRKLKSVNRVPAIHNALHSGHIVLIDAMLKGLGPASEVPAIINEATLFARNVSTSGYLKAVENNGGHGEDIEGDTITEFVSDTVRTLFDSPSHSLNLEIKETPDIPWDSLSEWVSPVHFLDMSDTGITKGRVDITDAVQQAANTDKTTLYFPNGSFRIEGTVHIGNSIRRIIGLETRLYGNGCFKVVNGESPVVVFERFENKEHVTVEQASSRKLVLSSSMISLTGEGPGEIFIEDVLGVPWHFRNQKVWARQINPEIDGTKIINEGGFLWILGLKTEIQGTVIETKSGGHTEVLGGNIYPAYGVPPPPGQPAFINDNSNVSISISENLYKTFYTTVVREEQDGQMLTLSKEDLPVREAVEESPDSVREKGAFILPLYVGMTDRPIGTEAGALCVSRAHSRPSYHFSFSVTSAQNSILLRSYEGIELYNSKGQRIFSVHGSNRERAYSRLQRLPKGITVIKFFRQ